jgi:hypothetical protein
LAKVTIGTSENLIRYMAVARGLLVGIDEIIKMLEKGGLR